jgi:CBS domain-containing protein
MKKVKDVMTKKVICLDVKSSITKAAKLMEEKGIGSVLITEKGKAAGIVTERDIITKCVAKGMDPNKVIVEGVMSTPLVSVDQDCMVDDAAKLMVSKMIRRLPIIDNGEIVGMLTSTDLIRNVAKKGRKEDSLVYLVQDYEKF